MNLFNRLLIWQKFTLGFVVIACFFIGIVTVYHFSMNQVVEDYEHLIDEDFSRYKIGSELLHKLTMVRNVEYNFRLTPGNELAEDHLRSFNEFLEVLQKLADIEKRSGHGRELKVPDGILKHAQDYRAAFVSTVAAWERHAVHSEEDLDKMEETNQAIEFLVEYHFNQVRKDMSSASEQTRAFSKKRTELALIMAFVLIILMITIAFLLVNSLVHPISKVTKAMLHVAEGNMTSQVPVIGKDELSQMAVIFNQMASQLQVAHDGLQNEQEKLMTILLSAREGIVGTNRDGRVVLVNPSAVRLLGKSEEQIVAEGFLNLIDDPDYVNQFILNSGYDMPDTIVYNNKIFNFFAASIKDKTGEIVGSAALIRDVTAEKNLERQLRDLSNTDGLTGLINRRRFDELMLAEFQRSQRYGVPFGLLLFDVDHFKKFNDTYGHDQGDRVLQGIANTMKSSFRDIDYCCRYGGEEFCIIAPNTAVPGLQIVAERFREKVEALVIDGLKVTISIGAVSYPLHLPHAKGPLEMFKAADESLYHAKKSGRNQVRLYSPQDSSA
ncbi:MAG: diguanylate cyclase [Magnetococcales bacterium]|nr:diguanylate cyclase [Magnetococcales bacterium]MBF0308034.1 diguanylate cyclase [Magnetococcales bacterium]